MTEPLFISPELYFEKIAAETDLPEDPNTWPQEILQELYKQAPYVSDFEPHVQMQKVDAEKGYGFGHIEISNQTEMQFNTPEEQQAAAGLRKARVPVVIKDGKLQPFDLLLNDASVMSPLTESRLRQAVFRPQAFDVTSKTPGDQSMIGQLYPPYRQNYGFGGGGMSLSAGDGKTASALEQFLEKEAAAIDEFLAGDRKHGRASKKWEEYEVDDEGRRKEAAASDYLLPAALVLGTAGATGAGVALGMGSAGRRQVGKELRDPRLYSNLRGMASLESADERVRAHKGLAKGDGTVMGAMRQGFLREGKEKTGSLLQAILPTINESHYTELFEALNNSPELRACCIKNAASVGDSLKLLAEYEPMGSDKTAGAVLSRVKPSVVQLASTDEGYIVKSASHLFWLPVSETVDRGTAVQRFGEKVVLAADTSGSVTMADSPGVEEPMVETQQAGPAAEPGVYKVPDENGKELLGYVIPNLIDLDGHPVPLALFTNGSQVAVQTDIIGIPAGEAYDLPSSDVPTGRGAFFGELEGKLTATVPLELQGSFSGPADPGVTVMQGQSFDGRPVEVSVQPNIQQPMGTPEGRLLVPQHWKWLPLDQAQTVGLASAEEADAPKQAARTLASVFVRGSSGSYSLSGPAVEKLASEDKNFIDWDGAMFVLSALGTEQAYAAQKLAEANLGRAPVQVRIGRGIKLASEQMNEAYQRASTKLASMPNLRRNLVKEASVVTDPIAVDTVLALGFINPENVMTFVSYMPLIDDAQRRMCELLLAARLGLSAIPSSALEKAVRATEEVLEGLKVMAFNG